jgi:hypothetical protein
MKVKISRAVALAKGLRRYYVGPCKNGHESDRDTHTNECVECRDIPRVTRPRNLKEPLTDDERAEYIGEISKVDPLPLGLEDIRK